MKQRLFKISKFAISTMALFQLAISQVHIKVITKVFASNIGFYLFLFILFGLVMTFSLSSMKKAGKMPLYLVLTVAAIANGIIYLNMLFADIATGAYLTMDVALFSIVISMVTLAIYLLGTITILLTREKEEKAVA